MVSISISKAERYMHLWAPMEIDGEIVRIIRHNCIFYEMAKTNGRVICDVLGKDMIKLPSEKGFSMKDTTG